MTIERVVAALPVTYRFELRGTRPVIVCLVCGSVSYHPMDMNQRYCACCAIFHGDRVEVQRQQFLLGVEPLPGGVVVVWVDAYQPDQVLCVHLEQPAKLANLDFGVKTPAGWRVVRHADWLVTLLSGERVIERGGVLFGFE